MEEKIAYEQDQKKESFRRSDAKTSKSGPFKVLMVTSKGSVAKSVANALCDGNYNKRRGKSSFADVYEYDTQLFGRNASFRVTSVSNTIYT